MKIMTASIAALLTGVASMSLATPAQADDCLLDTNDDGDADTDVDTDGGAESDDETNLACGTDATATGSDAIAIGNQATADGGDAIAIGGNRDFTDANNNGIPDVNEDADPANDVNNTMAIGPSTTAVGGQAVAMGPGATAFGWRSVADAERATALGHLADAGGVRSVAVGEAANASGDGAIALGNESVASGANSVAIGNGATATNDGQVVVASLDTSTGSQVGPVFVVTADGNGTLGRSSGFATNEQVGANTAAIGMNRAMIDMNTSAITDLQDRTTLLFDLANANSQGIREANEGVALALAMESPVLLPRNRFGVAGGFGYYNNRVAGSASVAARISENAYLTGGVGVGFDEGEVGARAGFQAAW